jgi:hypothetical protein
VRRYVPTISLEARAHSHKPTLQEPLREELQEQQQKLQEVLQEPQKNM